jgi:hypothetical protein
MIWAYYGFWLNRHIESIGDRVRQAGMKRLYNYILAFIGLVVSFVGVATLITFIIDMTTSRTFLMGDANRSSLATAISSLVVGIPLWLLTWRPMQAEALAVGEMGDHARRSVLRKTYLYLALVRFRHRRDGDRSGTGLSTDPRGADGRRRQRLRQYLLNLIQLLFLFAVVLVYHLRVLRADGASMADALAEKQSAFAVLVVDSGDGVVDSVKAALAKSGTKVQVTVTTPDKKPEGDFKAIVLSGSLATDAPAWIKSFGGKQDHRPE